MRSRFGAALAALIMVLGCSDGDPSSDGLSSYRDCECIDQTMPNHDRPDSGRLDSSVHDAARPDVGDLDAAVLDMRLRQDSSAVDMSSADVSDLASPDAEPMWLPPVPSDCPGAPGMAGVHMPDGRCYLIDSWFVTQGEYYRATQDHPPTSSHPHCVNHGGAGPRVWLGQHYADMCVVDQEFPEESEPGLLQWPPTGLNLEAPMACLTWCDAAAYCESVGKRLCGGAPADNMGNVGVDQDEWLNACTAGGTRQTPFAAQIAGDECLAWPPVRQAQCEGGFEGVWLYFYDASATPRWTRAVDAQTFECGELGPGSVRTPEPEAPGDWVTMRELGGIRCCADEPVE